MPLKSPTHLNNWPKKLNQSQDFLAWKECRPLSHHAALMNLIIIPNTQAHLLKKSEGNVMAWAHMSSSGRGKLIFIEVTHDDGS